MTTEVLSYTISAGATVRAPRGRLFFIKTAASPVSITASGRPGAPIKFSNVTAGLKYGPVDESEHWEYLEITSATAQTVEIIIGDDDVEVAGTVSVAGVVVVQGNVTTANTAADASCPATTATAVMSQFLRRSATFSNLSTNVGPVRIGDAGTGAARGIELQPGQSITLYSIQQVWVYNPNSSAVTIAMGYET